MAARARSCRPLARQSRPNTEVIRMVKRLAGLAACALTISVSVGAQAPDTPDSRVQRIRGSEQFAAASTFIDSDYERFVKELIALTEIPAPPFKEQARAKAYLEMLRAAGLSDIEIDGEGNAMGVRRGTAPAGGQMVAVVAH